MVIFLAQLRDARHAMFRALLLVGLPNNPGNLDGQSRIGREESQNPKHQRHFPERAPLADVTPEHLHALMRVAA